MFRPKPVTTARHAPDSADIVGIKTFVSDPTLSICPEMPLTA
jgi:hypothetical protein